LIQIVMIIWNLNDQNNLNVMIMIREYIRFKLLKTVINDLIIWYKIFEISLIRLFKLTDYSNGGWLAVANNNIITDLIADYELQLQ